MKKTRQPSEIFLHELLRSPFMNRDQCSYSTEPRLQGLRKYGRTATIKLLN